MDIGKVIKAKRLQLKQLLNEIDTLEAAYGLLEGLGPTNGRRKRRKRGRPRKDEAVAVAPTNGRRKRRKRGRPRKDEAVAVSKRPKNGRRRRKGSKGRKAAKAQASES